VTVLLLCMSIWITSNSYCGYLPDSLRHNNGDAIVSSIRPSDPSSPREIEQARLWKLCKVNLRERNLDDRYNTPCVPLNLLCFLAFRPLIRRFTPQPQRDKSKPSRDRDPYTRYPDASPTDPPASRPLVMSEMSDCNRRLLVHVGQEWSLVVDAEREDSVLVWQSERGAEDGAVRGLRNRVER